VSITIPCGCRGTNSECVNCHGIGTVEVISCRRCRGTGKEGGARCLDCRGHRWRTLDQPEGAR
jgi:hypothetical protein